jgi:hypothetical protein
MLRERERERERGTKAHLHGLDVYWRRRRRGGAALSATLGARTRLPTGDSMGRVAAECIQSPVA